MMAGEKTLSPSVAMAPQWYTRSTSASRAFIASTSPQSASVKSMPSGRFCKSPPIMLSQPTTRSPLWVNASARWLPRKPATPEMKTFILELEGAGTPQDRWNGSEKYADIEPERPLLDVLPVKVDDVLEVEHFAPSAHLPEAGDAGLGVEATEVVVLVRLEIGLEEGSRTDERHLADQNVEQLRQLVQTPPPKEAAESGDAWIVGNLEQANVARLIQMRELRLLCVRADAHRPELDHTEPLPSQAGPLLEKEWRAG